MGQMEVWLSILIAVLAAAVAGAAAFVLGIGYRKNKAEATIGSAEDEAKRIIGDAVKTAEAKKKEIVLEGKDEIHRLRSESEKRAQRQAQGDPASGAADPPEGGEPGKEAGKRRAQGRADRPEEQESGRAPERGGAGEEEPV